jgi:serine/threonine protein kinase
VTNPSNPAIAQTFKPGDKLAGCYTLKEILPPQGFCVLWLAHDEELNKDIVLHFVPDSVAADSRAMSELKNEAKRNRQLIHPRIVRVHDLVQDEKWAAISMDHVPGDTFAELQKKHDKNAFNPSEIASSVSELCQTIEDAHRIDLFHRDLTPGNIIASGSGVMVQKFGISRVILDSLARGGQQIDSARDIAYMSPQQLDGERPSRADDIYSLGASLFDLLTGTPPFGGSDIIPQIRKTVPPLLSEHRAARGITSQPVPKAWDDGIAACLAKVPEGRPSSAAEAGSRFAFAKAAPSPAAAATPSIAPVAAAAAATAAIATAATPPEPQPPANAGDASKTSPPPTPAEQEPAAKQQKRPWVPGPGKSPLITEATVLSKTAVPKAEPKEAAPAKPPEPPVAAGDGGGAKKGGPTTPTGFPLRAFVEVEGESKRPKSGSSAGLVAAGVVVFLILIVGYLVARNNGGNQPAESPVASTGTNSETSNPSSESTTPPTPVQAASPAAAAAQPVNVAATETPPPAPPAIVTESPAPSQAALAALTDAQAQQLLADKTKAVDQAKAALADAEKASQDKAATQTKAAAAVQELQATIKQKADAAAAEKKVADTATAALQHQQDSLKKAQADADAAQKAAAAKAQAAQQLGKAVQDAQAAAQQQQTLAQQAQADADEAAKTVADRQQAADAATKAAADAEKARQQQAQAVGQAQADLTQLQGALDQARNTEKARQAAEEAARVQKEREAETARLTAQAAAAEKAAADAQKALDNAKKAVADAEKAQADAEREAEAARNGTLPLPTPASSPESAAPAATPPAGAAETPASGPGAPTLSIHGPNPHMKVDQALSNSLGMRFAPVGNIFFSVWLTRVQDFAAFANATGYQGTAWQDPGFKQAPDHPVVNVSWNDANQFCLWLTQKEHNEGILSANQTYRLPTDLEWSNAVGLPPETGHTPESRDMDVPDVYPWGTQWPPPAGAGNYTGEETDSDVAIKGYNDGFAWTSPVGSFNANKFGLYDMGGNVWEWCEDWWNSEQKSKVLRGGSWYNGALKLSLLSSCRIHAAADQGTDNYGFRIVLSKEMTREKGRPKPSKAP